MIQPRKPLIALIGILVTSATIAFGEPVDYTGHKTVRVDIQTEADLELLLSISPDIHSDYIGVRPLDARIPPGRMDDLVNSGLSFTILQDNIQELIERERIPVGRGTWDAYMEFDEIISFINDLETLRPDLCEVSSIGSSIEGRDIWMLHITGDGGSRKPAVFYHGLIHAREWIVGPVVLYLADHLVNNYDTDPYVQGLVDGLDIYLAPVVNPDGYVYTQTNRMWRKNRRNNGDGSFGVDLNRNWGYMWGYDDEGSSPDPSNDLYRGPAPFSEPETQALSNFIIDDTDVLAYMDYHSHGQLILWPWGYDCLGGPDEPDATTYNTLGANMQSLIYAVHGEYYDPGPICETINYVANGSSVDWVYGNQSRFGFTIELRDTGYYGFLLPPEQILPTCEENLPAILHLTEWALDQVGMSITFPNGLPEILAPGISEVFDVEVAASYDTLVPGSPTLHYRYDGGAYQTAALTFVSGNLYQAMLPAAGCNDTPEYYFSAEGITTGVTYEPATAPTDIFTVPVGEFAIFFSDDFETNQGWTVENSVGLTDGPWDRGIPVDCNRGDPPSDYDGSGQCYLTDNSDVPDCNSDVDGGYTWLMSPTIDLSDTDEANVNYALWYTNNYGGSPNSDLFKVYVSDNDGTDWTLVETIGPNTSSGWVEHAFAVSDYVTLTNQVKVRFEASDLGGGSVVEAGVDGFSVFTIECIPGNVVAPLPEDSLGIGCTVDTECGENEARCIQGTCYAPKHRYLSIARNPVQVADTARRVKLDTGNLIGWVGEPDWNPPTAQHDGLWISEIVVSPHYETLWPDVVLVTGCEIGHASLSSVTGVHCYPNDPPSGETCELHSYYIQAIPAGQDVGDEGNYSETLELHTPSTWGDTVSTCNEDGCRPPDGTVGLADIMSAIGLFQGDPVAPITWLDIAPSGGSGTPDQNVGLGDIMGCIGGFQGEPYPGLGPLNCP